jgi:hypothetical protein
MRSGAVQVEAAAQVVGAGPPGVAVAVRDQAWAGGVRQWAG